MATVYEIIQGLSQAAANAYDGALDENGEPLKVGLSREEGDPLIDKRVLDGFGVRFMGPYLCINYQTEVQLKEVYASGFESDMEQTVEDIATFLSSSRVRSWATAYRKYRIGGIQDVVVVGEATEDRVEKSYRDFLNQGGFKGQRPDNDTRKK